MHVRSHLCERARLWASLRADGELSELEGALLDAHLARCAECRSVAGGVGALARWGGCRACAAVASAVAGAPRRVPLERRAPRALPVPPRHSKARLVQLA